MNAPFLDPLKPLRDALDRAGQVKPRTLPSLRGCPFCGAIPRVVVPVNQRWWVSCPADDSCAERAGFTEAEAITLWNQRAP